ncbi:MAG: hypothetical protein HFJ29_00165 [Clostridia bacterium]|nr:hypothetical protein [Clostridia bacterium]
MKNLKTRFYPFLQKGKKIILILLYNLYVHIFKCHEKKVLIASNTKNNLYGNLLYIYEELKQYDYDIQIMLTDEKSFWKKIQYEFKILYHVATSKYILIDDFFPLMYVLKIRKGTKFIQVWHALGAYKKVGYSRKDIKNENSLTHKNYTDAIVSSDSIIANYAEAFGINKEKIHALGIPRTDLFFNEDIINQKRENIYEQYPILKNKRVILFAPTFRGSGRKSAHYPESYINLKNIYENLKENEIFIIKLHPFIKNAISIDKGFKDKIIDLTSYYDINDLLLVTDLLITDYSSVIFEYSLMEKPAIFYVPDLEEYDQSRSFYYDYQEYMYGTIAKSQGELIQNMQHVAIDSNKIEKFKEKFLNKCDGKATKRFVEELILK